ncbi:unnamed protein product, partial [Mycena citricolor]
IVLEYSTRFAILLALHITTRQKLGSCIAYSRCSPRLSRSPMSEPGMPPRRDGGEDPKRIGLWKIGRTIGTGSSGRVRIARNSRTGQYAAVKIVSKACLDSTRSLEHLIEEVEHTQLSVEREIVVMKLIDHPNIMRLYDVWETSSELYLILEYVQGGELFEYLCSKGRLPTDEALRYFQQIIAAIDYCHKLNIAHRDLKPENILLDENLNVKIADFGMAAWQANGMLRTSCGSPHYAAPEIVSAKAYSGSAADIWSCGVILHALLAGKLPFDDPDLGILLEKVKIGTFRMPTGIDPLAQDLIRKMLTANVEDRITMVEVLRHPFYTSMAPTVIPSVVPALDNVSQPLDSLDSIDPDIFANLRTLWHGVPDSDIVASLQNGELNWQKRVYHLLVNYRNQHFEDMQAEEELVSRRKKKKTSKMKHRAVLESSSHTSDMRPSQSSLPPHNDSLTPFVPTINFHSATPSPDISAQCPSTLPPLVVPQLEDDKMQVFFHQIVNHLNTLQVKSPDPSQMSPNHLLDVLSQFPHPNEAVIAPPPTPANLATRPLSLHRKERHPRLTVDTRAEDKENAQMYAAGSAAVTKRSSLRSDTARTTRAKKVQILDPPPGSKLKRRKASPLSPAFSEAGSSFTLPSPCLSPASQSPKRTWFGHVFKFKPVTCSLESVHEFHVTKNECRRVLMGMDVRVVLEDADGGSVLRCRFDEFRDPAGVMTVVKAVKFRVEVQRCPGSSEGVSLVLVHEKGSVDTFKEIFKRLRREWVLDDIEAPLHRAIVPSPVVPSAIW